MKTLFLFVLLSVGATTVTFGQSKGLDSKAGQAISKLIDSYAQARETQDTLLLKSILTTDIDQLVSTGEWREGIEGSMAGMVRSTESNAGGSRTLKVEKVRFIGSKSAIADARYVIVNADGVRREMWSTFVVVNVKGKWEITAIRNMLPAR
ncbi:SgcJ/EcaC family oxidoreductase [Persicitalea sp.]|uniref:SgcJ/EcaC family oxidoreductase n=1 Tax=Persicitalea sp. TaxID=3100273 RepID=UPI0035940A28